MPLVEALKMETQASLFLATLSVAIESTDCSSSILCMSLLLLCKLWVNNLSPLSQFPHLKKDNNCPCLVDVG